MMVTKWRLLFVIVILWRPISVFSEDDRVAGFAWVLSADELARVNRLVEALQEREKRIPYVTLRGEREISAAKDYNAYFADVMRLSESSRKAAGGSFPPPTKQPILEPGHVLKKDAFAFSAVESRLCRVDLLNDSPDHAAACHCFDGERWQISDGVGNTAKQVRVSAQAGVSPLLYGPGLLGSLWGLGFNQARQQQGPQQSMSEFLKQKIASKRLMIPTDLIPEVGTIHPEDVVVSCFVPGENAHAAKIHLRLVIRFDSQHGFAPGGFFLQHVTIAQNGQLSGLTSQEYAGGWDKFAEVRPGVWLPGQLTLTEGMKVFIPEGWKFDTTTKDAWKTQKGETRAYAVKQERYTFRDITVSDQVPALICPDDYRPGTKVADMESKLGYELTAVWPAVNNDAQRIVETLEPPILATSVPGAAQTQQSTGSFFPGLGETKSGALWLMVFAGIIFAVAMIGGLYFWRKKNRPAS